MLKNMETLCNNHFSFFSSPVRKQLPFNFMVLIVAWIKNTINIFIDPYIGSEVTIHMLLDLILKRACIFLSAFKDQETKGRI